MNGVDVKQCMRKNKMTWLGMKRLSSSGNAHAVAQNEHAQPSNCREVSQISKNVCLKCRKPFKRRHKFHRICNPCSEINKRIMEEVPNNFRPARARMCT